MIGRLRSWFDKRRDEMAVKKERDSDGNPTGRLLENTVFHLRGDALEPRPAPWGFILRNPVQLILKPRESRRVNLLVSADVPMMVWAMRSHTDDVKVEDSFFYEPGKEVAVTITNPSDRHPLDIADGEGLVCVHPLTYSGTSSVG